MRHARRKLGFNLIEVLIACTLISIIVISLFGVWAMHAKANAQSRSLLIASALAQQLMESQLSAGYTASNVTPTAIALNATNDGLTTSLVFNLVVNTSLEMTNSDQSALKVVQVYVYWNDVQGYHIVNTTTRLSWEG